MSASLNVARADPLDSLARTLFVPDIQRGSRHASDEFLTGTARNRDCRSDKTVVIRYRMHLESRHLGPNESPHSSTILQVASGLEAMTRVEAMHNMTSASHQHRRHAGFAIAFAVLIAVAPLETMRAQAPAGQAGGRGAVAPAEALFTSAQAAAGQVAYQRSCASCHGALVDDGDSAPPLRGLPAFLGKYAGKPVADLFTYVSTKMPAGNPASLTGAEYAQIIAYVLQQNNFATGRKELASDAAALGSVMLPAPPGGRGGAGARASLQA